MAEEGGLVLLLLEPGSEMTQRKIFIYTYLDQYLSIYIHCYPHNVVHLVHYPQRLVPHLCCLHRQRYLCSIDSLCHCIEVLKELPMCSNVRLIECGEWCCWSCLGEEMRQLSCVDKQCAH